MPAATLEELGLGGKTPAELEARRLQIVDIFKTQYKGYEDPDAPPSLLNEMAVILSSLRRKNAGPPKAEKAKKASGPKPTAASLDF